MIDCTIDIFEPKLKDDLIEGTHFIAITQTAWRCLTQYWGYKVQPVIERNCFELIIQNVEMTYYFFVFFFYLFFLRIFGKCAQFGCFIFFTKPMEHKRKQKQKTKNQNQTQKKTKIAKKFKKMATHSWDGGI